MKKRLNLIYHRNLAAAYQRKDLKKTSQPLFKKKIFYPHLSIPQPEFTGETAAERYHV